MFIEFYKAAQMFTESGIACLRFDYRGQGISEGEFVDTSMATKTEDILNIIEYLKGCYYCEGCNIILLGFSDGAKTIAKVISKSDDVQGIILWNPIFNTIKDGFEQKKIKRLVRLPSSQKTGLPFLGLLMGVEHLYDVKTSNCLNEFKTFAQYKTIITGDEDQYTDYIRDIRWRQNIPNCSYAVIHGGNHTFSSSSISKDLIDVSINHIYKCVAASNKNDSHDCLE